MMPDLMVDIETTGTDPGHNGILQIAAVRFNYERLEVGPSFCAAMHLPYGRVWDEDTRSWWVRQGDTYERITANALPAEQVMPAFMDWALQTGPLAGDDRFWAKPISFDYPFVQSYCRQFGLHSPWHYRNAVDLNSFMRGLGKDPGAAPYEKNVPFQGEKHDALDDVLYQIRVLLTAKLQLGS